MRRLTIDEIQLIARAIVATGGSFYCRRLLQRCERGEISFPDMMTLLERVGRLPPRPQPASQQATRSVCPNPFE